jgi:phosphotransferase system enzyme I (PtsI)
MENNTKLDNLASKGIVMGKVFVVEEINLDPITTKKIDNSEKSPEISCFTDALQSAEQEIAVLAKNNDIFQAHLDIIQSETLSYSVIKKIEEDNDNAQVALRNTENELAAMLEILEDEYLRERATDIRDICKRIMSHLKGIDLNVFKNIKDEVIIIAKDLTPSDTSNMDFDKVKGFITQLGGVTGHVCIIARSIGLPAAVGQTNIWEILKADDFVILDTVNGILISNPTPSTINEYKIKIEEYTKKKNTFREILHLPAETTDKHHVELFANVGSLTDIEKAMQNGAGGVGLFRTEFLYMESKDDFPTEEEQFEVYKKSAILCDGKPIIIRTLDIGGDKDLPYYKFTKEENPFLGWRAIRMCLELTDMFKDQLRALLRASAYGDILIMYPMIISLEEYRTANALLQECKDELLAKNIAFNKDIKTGIMIETPASVICAEDLAKEVDFFSIGTNDLTQYLLAVDRGNDKISPIYDSFHPAVLRAIKTTIDAGHKYNKIVGMCGEFASNAEALPILLGMGLDEFSMASVDIAETKYKIRNMNYAKTKEFADTLLKKSTVSEIRELLRIVV